MNDETYQTHDPNQAAADEPLAYQGRSTRDPREDALCFLLRAHLKAVKDPVDHATAAGFLQLLDPTEATTYVKSGEPDRIVTNKTDAEKARADGFSIAGEVQAPYPLIFEKPGSHSRTAINADEEEAARADGFLPLVPDPLSTGPLQPPAGALRREPLYRSKLLSDPNSSRPDMLVSSPAEEAAARADGFTMEIPAPADIGRTGAADAGSAAPETKV